MAYRPNRIFLAAGIVWSLLIVVALLMLWPRFRLVATHRTVLSGDSVNRAQVSIIEDAGDIQMPDNDLKTVEIGELMAILPAIFETESVSGDGEQERLYQCGTMTVGFSYPARNMTTRKALLQSSNEYRLGELHPYVRTLVDIYSVDSNDFSWTMSPSDLQYHVWLLSQAKLQTMRPGRVEVKYGFPISAIVHRGRKPIMLEWYAFDGEYYGFILVDVGACEDVSSDTVVRILLQSLSWRSAARKPPN